ncbi:hypothetical protein ATZ33_02675 [Enterococcus silesiacus]|uniref:Methyltransferase type 11 domain-containing protein n=1 Tax=Enterococcus silesiacus TaxID=332949 RepID=A0A0S3K7R0_9ENTE|nr:class I SAM-dependent methyltransferase [Enterococcus silesiacus]ALS00318.1 hypothetical protein ATZ33_02675 [Enterococcus silesiacus]OJG93307.1 hypothetical protein RV15_GL001339 [Enterococcus silesiacus]
MLIWIICCIFLLLICLFLILLKQSKTPTGYIGILMMRLWNRVYLPLVKWTMTKVALSDQMTILDIGVGNGVSSRYLLDQANALSVTGIDISKDAITQAKKYVQNKNLNFETMDVHSLGFAPETFDFVTAFQTHFHWNDLDKALSEINRVLKHKGIVVFSCETAKINYFLPKFKKPADFNAYLSDHNFLLYAHHTTNQWSMYAFQKE